MLRTTFLSPMKNLHLCFVLLYEEGEQNKFLRLTIQVQREPAAGNQVIEDPAALNPRAGCLQGQELCSLALFPLERSSLSCVNGRKAQKSLGPAPLPGVI